MSWLNSPDPDGDTIIEVMVVLAVLGLAIGICYATANRSLLNTRQAQENTIAATYVQSQIEALRTMTTNTGTGTGSDNIFTQPSAFCVDTTHTPYKVVNAATTPAYPSGCQLDSPPYTLSISYKASATDPGTFTVTASWPDVLGQGTDTVTEYYRLHGPVVATPPPPPPSGGDCSLPASLAALTPSFQVNEWPMDYVAGTGADSPFYTTTPELAKGAAGDHGPLHNSTGSSPNKVVAFTAAFCSDYYTSLTGDSCIAAFNWGDLPGGIFTVGADLIDATGTVQPIPGAQPLGPGVPGSYYCQGAGAPTGQILVNVSGLATGTHIMQLVGAIGFNGVPPNQPYIPYDDTSYPMYHPNYVKFQVN